MVLAKYKLWTIISASHVSESLSGHSEPMSIRGPLHQWCGMPLQWTDGGNTLRSLNWCFFSRNWIGMWRMEMLKMLLYVYQMIALWRAALSLPSLLLEQNIRYVSGYNHDDGFRRNTDD